MHERDDTFQGYGPIICLKSAILDFPSISLSNKTIIAYSLSDYVSYPYIVLNPVRKLKL